MIAYGNLLYDLEFTFSVGFFFTIFYLFIDDTMKVHKRYVAY